MYGVAGVEGARVREIGTPEREPGAENRGRHNGTKPKAPGRRSIAQTASEARLFAKNTNSGPGKEVSNIVRKFGKLSGGRAMQHNAVDFRPFTVPLLIYIGYGHRVTVLGKRKKEKVKIHRWEWAPHSAIENQLIPSGRELHPFDRSPRERVNA